MTEENGTLEVGEIHPAAPSAMTWIKEYVLSDIKHVCILKEALASCALSGNRLAEICYETLRRIIEGEDVSDRYLLGLAWYLKQMREEVK